ncbi:hypothetical protein CN918_28820 [Priestia megaterium]|nr:hypothetical protein CN918_28820 [Priestia megaterium]
MSFITAFITKNKSTFTVDVVESNKLLYLSFVSEHQAEGLKSPEAVEEYLADIESKSGKIKRVYLAVNNTTPRINFYNN